MGADSPGAGGLLDPDGALEHLAAWKSRIDQMATRTQEMSGQLERLHVTLADDNGLVEVTVDAAGVLLDLRLSARIQRTAPDVTATAILETLKQARAQLAQRSQEIIAETMGPGSAAGREITERVGRQLQDPDGDSGDSDSRDVDWRRWRT